MGPATASPLQQPQTKRMASYPLSTNPRKSYFLPRSVTKNTSLPYQKVPSIYTATACACLRAVSFAHSAAEYVSATSFHLINMLSSVTIFLYGNCVSLRSVCSFRREVWLLCVQDGSTYRYTWGWGGVGVCRAETDPQTLRLLLSLCQHATFCTPLPSSWRLDEHDFTRRVGCASRLVFVH